MPRVPRRSHLLICVAAPLATRDPAMAATFLVQIVELFFTMKVLAGSKPHIFSQHVQSSQADVSKAHEKDIVTAITFLCNTTRKCFFMATICNTALQHHDSKFFLLETNASVPRTDFSNSQAATLEDRSGLKQYLCMTWGSHDAVRLHDEPSKKKRRTPKGQPRNGSAPCMHFATCIEFVCAWVVRDRSTSHQRASRL